MIFLYIVMSILIFIVGYLYFFPYSFIRMITFILRHTIYRVEMIGENYIPQTGAALLVANHVSPFDAMIIMGLSKRKIHFMMHHHFYRGKYFNWLFRKMGVIEVPAAVHTKKMQKFLQITQELLRNGEVVCAFPEGGVSENGLISHFKNGIEQMLPENLDIPVIPIRMGMMRGSLFAIHEGRIKFVGNRSLPLPISVMLKEAIPRGFTSYELRQYISEMGAEAESRPYKGEKTLHYNFLKRAKRHFFQVSYQDYGQEKGVNNFTMLIKSLIVSRKIRELPAYKDSDLIGVLLPNCTNLAMTILGVLFSDKVPAILNFSSGEEILKKVIDNSNIKVILTSKKFLDKVNLPLLPNMILLEDVAKTIDKKTKSQVARDVLLLPSYALMKKYAPLNMYDLNKELVVLFSSGSTGVPKGVMLTHRNINSNIQSFGRTIHWRQSDIILGSLPIFHAYGFNVCFAFSAVEGIKTVYVLSPLDAQSVCDCVVKHGCTMMMATPTFLQNYMRRYKAGQFDNLRLVITGAEKLRHDISSKFREMTNLEVTEGFGCTELSPIVSINLSQSFMQLGKKYGKKDSIGAPLPGIHVKIVDPESFAALPPDTPGLMLVKGGLVMKGYLNDEENTRNVMYEDYYKTGDIASMSSDGYITITGRLSRFSKIAGEMVPHEMVELSINEVLQSEERVVAVSSKSDEKRGEKLVVFYAIEELNPAEMVEALRAKELPNLWIPKVDDFIKIEKIPLLGSGKIDLQSLKKLAEK